MEGAGTAICGAWSKASGLGKTGPFAEQREHRGASRRGGPPQPLRRLGRGHIVGANRRGGAVTLVERKSGYLLLGKVPDLRATTVREAAAERYATTPAALRKTLTLDNGKEFAEHEQLAEEAALKIYFAKPYSAWQRGTNETPTA